MFQLTQKAEVVIGSGRRLKEMLDDEFRFWRLMPADKWTESVFDIAGVKFVSNLW